jgi:hypothetical protein
MQALSISSSSFRIPKSEREMKKPQTKGTTGEKDKGDWGYHSKVLFYIFALDLSVQKTKGKRKRSWN